MCIVTFSEKGATMNFICFKVGRLLVILLNLVLISIICMILTEVYGVIVFRDGGYTEWTEFTPCQVTCGGGSSHRRRTCTNPEPTLGGNTCDKIGPSVEIIVCNPLPCPIDGGFERWSKFGACSVSCGGEGKQKRIRHCIDPVPKFGGKNCAELNLGPYEESRDCNNGPCPIDGGYSEWSEWSECSGRCGPGKKSRKRSCTNPAPSGGGKDCSGQGVAWESTECMGACPVDGRYGQWTKWNECSVPCGGGYHKRTRLCDQPSPSGGGRACLEQGFGNPEDVKPCNTGACNRDGAYTQWGAWSQCDVTCGGGRIERRRTCTNPTPHGKGRSCRAQGLGASIEMDECNFKECPY